MTATNNGFIYIKDTKVSISEFKKGNKLNLPISHDFFYGTKEEAIEFGLNFNYLESNGY